MAFFGSNGYERNLKRSISTTERERDRPRRDRPAGARAVPNGGGTSSPTKSIGVDELGFVVSNASDKGTGAAFATSVSISVSTSASASLASSSLNPSGTAIGTSSAAGPSNTHASTSQRRMNQNTPEKGAAGPGTSSGSRQRERTGSNNSSPNPSSSRRRTSSNGLKAPSTPESAAAGAGGSPRNSLRARSSPDLKERDRQRERVKSRPNPPSRQGSDEKPRAEQGERGELLLFTRTTSATGSVRAPKGPRPLIRPESRSSANAPSPAATTMSSLTRANGGFHSQSGSLSLSPAQIREESEGKSPKREKSFDVSPAPSRTRQDDSNLSPPSMSTKKSNTSKSNGNLSDSSYGSPLSELGVVGSFTVKSLLARPAASTLPGGVRSEPDIDYGNATSMTAASRRYLRAGGTSPVPHSPSVYSQGSTVDANAVTVDNLRKAALSEPESSSPTAGSLGRSRGLEWGHILAKKNVSLGNQTHTRDQSGTFSLSSPSEGTMFPYGRMARERNQSTPVSKADASLPLMQLTTNAVKRLSALGAREAERSGMASPPPCTYVPPPSPRPPISPVKQSMSTGSGEVRRKSSRHRVQEGKKESAAVMRREDSPPPVGLTPAELIMHRYKQQERRRRELEKGATRDAEQPEKLQALQQSMSKPREKSSKKSASKGKDDVDDGVGPYYTVFGASSEQKQNIGNARDSAFGLFDKTTDTKAAEKAVVAELNTPGPQITAFVDISFNDPTMDTTGDCKLVHQKSLRRKLSKKMSGRIRDGSVSMKPKEIGEDGVFSGSEDTTTTKSRPSLSLSTATGKRPDLDKITNPSKSAKNSLESFVAVPDAGSGRPMPSATNGPPRLEKHNGRSASDGDKEKGKIWGFVKKISSHTLNNKYRRNSAEFIPPVPAIPLEHTINIDIQSESIPLPIMFEREKKSKRTVHGRRPSTAPALNSDVGRCPVEGRFAVMRKKPSLAQLTREPRSSSPSTDNASSMKFKHSSGSSSSSLNEGNGQKPAVSKSPLVQHILPPETLHMLEEFNAQYSSLGKESPNLKLDLAPAQENSAELFYGYGSLESPVPQGLPVPPRKQHQPTTPASSRSESPTIPTFSADNAINTFGPGTRNRALTMSSTFTGADFGTSRKSSTTESFQDKTNPPPRPPRSMKRGPNSSNNLLRSNRSSGSSKSSSSSPSITNARDSQLSVSAQSAASTCRPSGSFRFSSHFSRSHSTPQQTHSGSTSPSPPPELLENISPISASDSTGSAVTFRDAASFTPGLKQLLSEKEKVDKWNDLLDRSDRAGGTLHVGLGGLLSDNIRDSALEPIPDDLSFVSL